jgi:hypothetical protein
MPALWRGSALCIVIFSWNVLHVSIVVEIFMNSIIYPAGLLEYVGYRGLNQYWIKAVNTGIVV